jgi:hypothetical protein
VVQIKKGSSRGVKPHLRYNRLRDLRAYFATFVMKRPFVHLKRLGVLTLCVLIILRELITFRVLANKFYILYSLIIRGNAKTNHCLGKIT